jgi:SAM-dependent methyltransferase
MTVPESWEKEYLEEKFSNPDPWNYFSSPYEQKKYCRQIDAMVDRHPSPGQILEIGSAEGAHTLLLAKQLPSARITAIEISSQAAQRAKRNIAPFADRIELINADVVDIESRLRDFSYDICIWSESIYYLGARLSVIGIYDLIRKIVGKLRPGGLLVMANSVEIPQDIPESAITGRPVIDSYYSLISSMASLFQNQSTSKKKWAGFTNIRYGFSRGNGSKKIHGLRYRGLDRSRRN